LRYLYQLDMGPGQGPAILVEVRPVGVRPPCHHPPALGERIGDRPEVGRPTELVARPEREILVVEKQRDPLFLIQAAEGTLTSRIDVGQV
jgi:hypothetical protein